MPVQGQRRRAGRNRWAGSQVSQVLRLGREKKRRTDCPFLKSSERVWVGSSSDKHKDHRDRPAIVAQVLSYQGWPACGTGLASLLPHP